MATFTWSVDVATQAKTDAALVKTQYGDGYMQRRPAGIHALRRTYSVQVNADTATLDAVEAFLRANAITGFEWLPMVGETPNLVTNPGFVPSAGGWATGEMLDASTPGVPANAPAANVLKVIGWGSGDTDTVQTAYIPCQPGDVFDYELWIGLPAALTTNVGFAVFQSTTYPQSGTIIGNALNTISGNYTGWKKVSGSYTVPPGFYSFQPILFLPSADAGVVAYFALPAVTRPKSMFACDGWTRTWDSAAGGSITADFVEWFA